MVTLVMTKINNFTPNLDSFVGNESIVSQIKDNIAISLRKGVSFPSTLLYGQSGCGKDTLAYAIAEAMGTKLIEVNCGSLSHDLTTIIMKAPTHSIIFLDEIHSMPMHTIEGFLYRYLDEGIITIRYPDGQLENLTLPTDLTIMGATTEPDKVPTPLYNRFQQVYRLKPYTHDQMIAILKLNLSRILTITDDAYAILANATRYVPRMAVQYSNKIKNYAYQHNITNLTNDDITTALSTWSIDANGLTDDDHDYMNLLYTTFNNSPTGIKQLCAMLGESERTVIERENHLIREGYLKRTSRGRMLTGKAMLLVM